MSKAKADALGVKPLGYFRAFATAGVDPAIMGIGPIPAVRKLLAKTGLSLRDIDVVELNEAFASQSVYVQRTLEIPEDKLNVHGGAIALGHPLGCTGAKLTATALHELRRRKGRYAIVTMCIGGGDGRRGAASRPRADSTALAPSRVLGASCGRSSAFRFRSRSRSSGWSRCRSSTPRCSAASRWTTSPGAGMGRSIGFASIIVGDGRDDGARADGGAGHRRGRARARVAAASSRT